MEHVTLPQEKKLIDDFYYAEILNCHQPHPRSRDKTVASNKLDMHSKGYKNRQPYVCYRMQTNRGWPNGYF